MQFTIFFIILSAILIFLVFLFLEHSNLAKSLNESEDGQLEKDSTPNMGFSKNLLIAALIPIIIGVAIGGFFLIEGTYLEGHVREWLNIIFRLAHFTFGVAWIGASFYFTFLENALNRTKGLRDELAGNLWAIHGGGFYYLEKYKLAPKEVPKELHWFKYEAYFTWITGFSLLFVVYYSNSKTFLIDPNVLDISPLTSILIGVGSLIVAWIIYDILCKTPLLWKETWFAIILFCMCVGFAFFYTHVFSGRGAYIHFGAMLGTLMAANVFFVIIPSQKAMVKAAKEGKSWDPNLGKIAGLRSRHNNYFTLPVLFVMVSNHFPSTFGSEYAWQILIAITIGTAGIKHYLNLHEKGEKTVWILPISVLIILGVAFITAPSRNTNECQTTDFADVQTIFQKRCTPCHSSKPTDEQWKSPPNGVIYDTPQDIVKYKVQIMERVVVNKTMPQNNKTNMTPAEREIIRCWIEQGAKF